MILSQSRVDGGSVIDSVGVGAVTPLKQVHGFGAVSQILPPDSCKDCNHAMSRGPRCRSTLHPDDFAVPAFGVIARLIFWHPSPPPAPASGARFRRWGRRAGDEGGTHGSRSSIAGPILVLRETFRTRYFSGPARECFPSPSPQTSLGERGASLAKDAQPTSDGPTERRNSNGMVRSVSVAASLSSLGSG